MSYVRWGVDGSAVYVIGCAKGWQCVGCAGPDAQSEDMGKFLAHLDWHRKQGQTVPQYVYDGIKEDVDRAASGRG